MPDKYQSSTQSLLTPSDETFAVTPHDTLELSSIPKFLYVGRGGNITLRAVNATTDAVFENVPAGGYIYVRVRHVRATGTTAAAIVACA